VKSAVFKSTFNCIHFVSKNTQNASKESGWNTPAFQGGHWLHHQGSDMTNNLSACLCMSIRRS